MSSTSGSQSLLILQMLTLDPEKRITVTEALNHPYLDEGRLRYHSCMCACCVTSQQTGARQYVRHFEPVGDICWSNLVTVLILFRQIW